jgi:hypothetical protein
LNSNGIVNFQEISKNDYEKTIEYFENKISEPILIEKYVDIVYIAYTSDDDVYEIFLFKNKNKFISFLENILKKYYPHRIGLVKKDERITLYTDVDFNRYKKALGEFGKIEYLI